jgi:hypothetical protein
LTRLAASSKRRCWSQPHGPQSVPAAGAPDGAAPPGVAEPVGWPGAEPFAAGDPPVALAHLGDVPSVVSNGVSNTDINAIRPSAVAATEPVMNIRRLVTPARLLGVAHSRECGTTGSVAIPR